MWVRFRRVSLSSLLSLSLPLCLVQHLQKYHPVSGSPKIQAQKRDRVGFRQPLIITATRQPDFSF